MFGNAVHPSAWLRGLGDQLRRLTADERTLIDNARAARTDLLDRASATGFARELHPLLPLAMAGTGG